VLLRLRGIPTRYVTGFVVAHRNDVGDFWTAKNTDAHAWAEAYDSERGWILVESTPSSGVPQPTKTSWHRQIWDYLSLAVNSFRYEFTRGGWRWLAKRFLAFLITPQGVVISIALIAYVVWRQRSQFSFGRTPGGDPYLSRLAAIRGRVDALVLSLGLSRTPEEPIVRFADRIELELDRQDLAQWYRDYGSIRYRTLRDEGPVNLLERRAQRLVRVGERRRREEISTETEAVTA